jgi:hypothetical protein
MRVMPMVVVELGYPCVVSEGRAARGYRHAMLDVYWRVVILVRPA